MDKPRFFVVKLAPANDYPSDSANYLGRNDAPTLQLDSAVRFGSMDAAQLRAEASLLVKFGARWSIVEVRRGWVAVDYA
jgi:hypothetical protein